MKKIALAVFLAATLLFVSTVPAAFADDPGPVEVATQETEGNDETGRRVEIELDENRVIVGDIGTPEEFLLSEETVLPDASMKDSAAKGGIAVSSAWTTDGNGTGKNTFSPNDSIRWYGNVSNSTGSAQTAYFVWSVSSPCGASTLWSGNLTAKTGTWTWYLPGSVPSNACRGTYTYKLSVTFQGVTSSSSASYTVRGVTVSSAWTTDGSGNAKSSFNPGDAIGWYGNIVNEFGNDQTASFAWLLNSPCGSSTLWSGNLTTGAGTRTWMLPGTIPSNACVGTYTFTLQATFNGSTTSKAFSYTVNAANTACNAACQQMLNQSVKLNDGQTVQARNLPGTIPVKGLDDPYGKPGQWPFGQKGTYHTMADTPVKSDASTRYGDLYKAVIHQFGVDKNVRYTPSSGYTYCNTFAGDVARAMGHPFPKKSASDPATIGFPALYNWFTGGSSGWTKLDVSTASGMQKLIDHVNAGKMAVAVNKGHIAVIRPGQANGTKFSDLRIAQAGAKNNVNLSLSGGFGSSPTPLIYIHD
jgi:hypothetical protein